MAKEQSPSAVFKSYLAEYNLTASKVAADIKLSQSSIRLLIGGKLKISVPIALRLAKYFGNKAEYWVSLQTTYELAESARDPKLSPILKAIPKAKKQELKVSKTPKASAAKGAKTAKSGRRTSARTAK
ncbi:MAG: HigA family addiction module antidote protein [Treponema sp.]|jgi:addiction module HigA family antidote|nr:HigA family addiction module antidote protein [Treponema sp.]